MNNAPISIAIRDTKEKLIDVLNTSGLPIDVLVYIVKEIYDVASAQAIAEYEQTMKSIENSESPKEEEVTEWK